MIVDTAYDIQAHLLAGDSLYTPNYMFVEYKNVQNIDSNEDIEISDSTSSTDTIEHYHNLAGNDIDHLEIPIAIKPRIVEPTQGGSAAVEYSVVTSGITEGYKGLPFSSEAGSIIYGLGLVSRVRGIDSDTDILFAKTSLGSGKQLIKTTSDMYISWKIEI